MPKYKQYSPRPILASNFEEKGQENTTSYNLPYCPCYYGRNVRVKHLLKPDLLSHFLYSECLSYLRINYTDSSAQAIIQTCSHFNLVALP